MKKILCSILLMLISLSVFAFEPPIKNLIGTWKVREASMTMNVQQISVKVDMSKVLLSYHFFDDGRFNEQICDFKIRQMDIIKAATGKQAIVHPKVKDKVSVNHGHYVFDGNTLTLVLDDGSVAYKVSSSQPNIILLQQIQSADSGTELGNVTVKLNLKLQRIN